MRRPGGGVDILPEESAEEERKGEDWTSVEWMEEGGDGYI